MDLLLTHGYFMPDDLREQQVMKPYPPLGLLYLSSHLKQRGFDVRVFDSTFRSFTDFVQYLERERPSLVGIYCNLMTKRAVLRMMVECRRVGAMVILGGPEPPQYAAEYLRAGADAIAVGEGEVTLEELVPKMRRSRSIRDAADVRGLIFLDPAGGVVRTEPRPLIANLDAQPFPDREAIDFAPYFSVWRTRHGMSSVSLIAARGCPYTCTWCSRSVFGDTHRRRSPDNVADEVAAIVERYKPDMLWYADDVFTIHPGWILKYSRVMAARGMRIPFECISRPERINDQIADALARLGCLRLWIGSESGSQRVLDAMKRRVTVEQVQRATRLLQSRGIQVGMFLMLGYPGEQREDIEATIEHLKRASPDVFLATVAYPIKGTEYYDTVKDGLLMDGEWTDRTDRDIRIRGRHSPRYYRFAQQWMGGEVQRHRHWQQGRYLRSAYEALRSKAGQIGVALTEHEQER
jgi:anaerobic magnesium-protoporphyrin IX monomethyl ester cyclase